MVEKHEKDSFHMACLGSCSRPNIINTLFYWPCNKGGKKEEEKRRTNNIQKYVSSEEHQS